MLESSEIQKAYPWGFISSKLYDIISYKSPRICLLCFRLTETSFGKKGDYATYLKGYMKNVVKKLEENGKGDQVDGFKKNIQPYISEILKDWKDLMFFVGE